MRFEAGRQGTGYLKLTLWHLKRLRTDGYLIKYPEGSSIPAHTDPVGSHKHYRLNLVLKRPKVGGLFRCAQPMVAIGQCFFMFRPDEQEHEVTPVEDGSRWVFSVGLAIPR